MIFAIQRLNLPNRLTLGRLVLCIFFVASFSVTWPYAATTALGIFILASVTDWLDGLIARRRNLVTNLGKLLDPLADKVLISAALIGLVERQVAPMWMAVAIIAREFLITGLRLLAAHQQKILAAEKVGKHKTVTQMLAIGVSLLWLALEELGIGTTSGAHFLAALLPWLYWIAVLITVISGAIYFWKNRALFDAHS